MRQEPMWVWDSDVKRMVNKEIKFVPGFFKIIDEILVNAADNKVCVTQLTAASWMRELNGAPDQRREYGHHQGYY